MKVADCRQVKWTRDSSHDNTQEYFKSVEKYFILKESGQAKILKNTKKILKTNAKAHVKDKMKKEPSDKTAKEPANQSS